MTDVLFPPSARIASSQVAVRTNTATFPSIFTGSTRTTDRTGDKLAWMLSSVMAPGRQQGGERAVLQAIRARLRGQANRLLFIDPAYRFAGAFPAVELLASNDFASGTTGWSTSSAGISIAVRDRVLRSTRANVTGDETIRAAVAATVSGAQYIFRVFAYEGRGNMDFRLRSGTTLGGSELVSSASDITSGGLKTLTFTATGSSSYVSIVDGTSSRSIGNYQDFAYASLSRCALVQGASQTGSSLLIDTLPVSTPSLALAGDRIQVGNELHILTSPLDSDSSGAGLLHLAWPMRSSPGNDAPVIFHEPMARCMASANEGGWSDSPGVYSSFEFAIEEALDT